MNPWHRSHGVATVHLYTLGRPHVTRSWIRTLSAVDCQRVRGVPYERVRREGPLVVMSSASPSLVLHASSVLVLRQSVPRCESRVAPPVTLQQNVSGTWPARRRAPTPLPCFTTVVTRSHCCTSRPSPLAHCCALHIVALRPIVAADVVSVYDVYFGWNSCCSRYACESFKYSCFHFLKLVGTVQYSVVDCLLSVVV